MSTQYGKLCSIVIKQYFGESVQIVADTLFSSVSRTLSQIIKSTKLPKSDVRLALAVLIKFNLLNITPSVINENINEYSLKKENIIYVLRYSKYVHLIQSKFGNAAALIIEELLRCGMQTASNILIKCIQNSENKDTTLTVYRNNFYDMINEFYLKRIDNSTDTLSSLQFTPPDIDLYQLQQIIDGKLQSTIIKQKDNNILWKINYERFHQDFRDDIMIQGIEKKIDLSAGECFKFFLHKMYEKNDPWIKITSTNSITIAELKQIIDRNSNNLDLIKYIEQYVSVISDDSLNFIRRIGDMGEGQYIIEIGKGFYELTMCCIENIITEKFGSKASRIFRVIKTKKFIEQEDLQKEAMVPAKEAKLLTYKLFEEQYIHVKTIRKPGGGGTGPAKSFYLFYINTNQVVNMLVDTCYKALYNTLTRSIHKKNENKRLIDKSQKVESIVATMKERGESEEYIAEILETLTPPEREVLEKVKVTMRTLSKAELVLDETLFLLQMFLYYNGAFKDILKK